MKSTAKKLMSLTFAAALAAAAMPLQTAVRAFKLSFTVNETTFVDREGKRLKPADDGSDIIKVVGPDGKQCIYLRKSGEGSCHATATIEEDQDAPPDAQYFIGVYLYGSTPKSRVLTCNSTACKFSEHLQYIPLQPRSSEYDCYRAAEATWNGKGTCEIDIQATFDPDELCPRASYDRGAGLKVIVSSRSASETRWGEGRIVKWPS
jgi:hypothetical protein